MSHANAALTVVARRTLVERVRSGTPQATVAAQMGVSRATVSKWWRRWLTEGDSGLLDRSSRPDDRQRERGEGLRRGCAGCGGREGGGQR